MKLNGKNIVYLVEDGFEDLEFWVPLMRLKEEGANVMVASGRMQTFTGKHCLKATPEYKASEINPDEVDGIVIPGGWAPDKLRRYPDVLALIQAINEQGKIIGAICHAGLVLISAGIIRGRKAIGSKGIKDDLINAGATWYDKPAFRDGNIVWGRVVADIPDFCRELIAALED